MASRSVCVCRPLDLFVVPIRSAKWRREHEDFVANIREARAYTKAINAGKPPPPLQQRKNPHAHDGLMWRILSFV